MMNNKKDTTIARKLTLEEIITLPKATVLWLVDYNISDESIVWHGVDPVLVCAPGENGALIGGNRYSLVDLHINDQLLNDPNRSIWDREPTKGQLHGISREEYDAIPDELGHIQFTRLAYAITYRGFTFEQISDITGIKLKRIWNILTCRSEIEQCEIVAIRTALDLSDDETRKVFFPEFDGIVYDIGTGCVIQPDGVALI